MLAQAFALRAAMLGDVRRLAFVIALAAHSRISRRLDVVPPRPRQLLAGREAAATSPAFLGGSAPASVMLARIGRAIAAGRLRQGNADRRHQQRSHAAQAEQRAKSPHVSANLPLRY